MTPFPQATQERSSHVSCLTPQFIPAFSQRIGGIFDVISIRLKTQAHTAMRVVLFAANDVQRLP
jgi:hypothetical protein